MNHPDFFNDVPTISLYDPLAEFLGATEGGILQYSYFDAVKLAGHSCPTVAAAYWMTYKALAFLYQNEMPIRGDILVEFSQAGDSGVTGVIANVVSMLTGATADTGFKGIAGRFVRRDRLCFEVEIPGEIRFCRMDTNQAVITSANVQRVPASPRMPSLIASCLANRATPDEVAEFRSVWQERVRSVLLDHGNNPEVFVITPV